ncbi:hypothetical protein BpHYR1_023603 [Brachionus plicatilis]|uniref:Uncharacterized protein n=1 Tax=Brachionus plicatilis TaxID=10195 RepID=A0A3M7QXY4_BRAPC|nr:hypothetical protein BpHYR1_023603 [Brachionus plicatilis]
MGFLFKLKNNGGRSSITQSHLNFGNKPLKKNSSNQLSLSNLSHLKNVLTCDETKWYSLYSSIIIATSSKISLSSFCFDECCSIFRLKNEIKKESK